MLFSFVLSVLTLSLSTAATPTDSAANPPPVGSFVDYSGYTFQPLQDASALNSTSLRRRQEFNFTLIDATPDPVIAPDNYTNYDQEAAIDAVVAEISSEPLPQKRDVSRLNVYAPPSGYASVAVSATAAINAPLNCNGSDTYMGSKLFNSGPFDESLCAAACTAQSAYNLKHPPASGSPKTCQFYNTYVLLKDGASQGQYCALYTQAWDGSYATNVGQWRGTAHYTIQQSVAAANATNSGQGSCPSDIPYMLANGGAFCSSFLSYVPPTSTVVSIVTPTTSVITSVDTKYTTETDHITYTSTNIALTTVTTTIFQKRDLATPASAVSWSPSRLSRACSAVVTGSTTIVTTKTAATPLSTLLTTVSATTTLQFSSTTLLSSTSTVISTFSPTATLLGQNLVANPGFEEAGESSGGLGWTTTIPLQRCNNAASRGIVLPYDAYEGTAICEFYFYPDNPCLAFLRQTITGFSTTHRYTLGFYYWARIGEPNTCSFVVSLGGVMVWSFSPSVIVSRPATYVKVSVPGIVPQAATQDLVFTYSCTHLSYLEMDFVTLQQESYS
ncbi:hypothetical protein KCU78_g7787, partial [Aureobasidium melanogenum]